jgi:hypothetical protein
MPHAIPVVALSRPEVVIGSLSAEISFVRTDGALAKVVEEVPVENGVAVYSGPPLPPGLLFGVRIRSSERGLVFRSGPLPRLPGPPSQIVATNGTILVYVTGFGFSLTDFGSDGLPEILVQNLQNLTPPMHFQDVRLGTDGDGHYSVTLNASLRLAIFTISFSYTRLFDLLPNTAAGRLLPIVLANPVGSGSMSAIAGAPYRGVLDALIKHAIEQQLDAALLRLVNLDLEVANLGAYGSLSLVSVNDLHLVSVGTQAQMEVGGAGGGAITGVQQVLSAG